MDQQEQWWQDRVTGALDSLTALTETASKAKESGKDARRLVSAFQQVADLYALDVLNLQSAEIVANLQSVKSDLEAMAGTDRTDGDTLSANLRGMLQSGIPVADDLKAKVEAAVSAWQATNISKTKSTGGTRATAGNGSGINVEVKCSCGWIQHDSTDCNSMRWQILKHLEGNSQSHPTITVKPSGRMLKDGTFGPDTHPDWAAITTAVKPVADGQTASTESAPISDGSVFKVCVA